MLLHRLKIAFRMIIRQRFFSALNLFGLAIGSACILLIYTYVSDELSFDQFHEKAPRLYRINMTNIWIENNDIFGSTGPAVAGAIRNDIPEAESIVRIYQPFLGSQIVSILDQVGNNKTFEEDNILATDQTFFDVFTFPMIAGNPQTSLVKPNSAVISQTYAEKYFADETALGKQISFGIGENKLSYLVTGVIDDVPHQSHFDFDILLSMNSFPKVIDRSDAWIWTGFVTYMTLAEGTDVELVKEKLKVLPQKYVTEEVAAQKNWGLYLQKVTDIRLYSDSISNRLGTVGSINNVIIFSTVALLILLLSCINFMNLSTARYAGRAKEVGIQKVLGSSNNQIRGQFLFESLIYSFLSVILGFGIAEITKGWFNALSGKLIDTNLIEDPMIIILLVGLILTIGLLSGSYPAWFLTRFKIVNVLKGKAKQAKSQTFRNTLVIFQFTISIALLGGSFLVKDQLNYLNEKDLGFDEENILVIKHMEWMEDKGKLFRDQLLTSGLVKNASITNATPPNIWYQEQLTPQKSKNAIEDLAVSTWVGDYNLLPTLGIDLLTGRNFFAEGESDNQSVIINKECAVQMGWIDPEDDIELVLGNKLNYYDPENSYTVVGIVNDFNFWSLDTPVEPLAIFHPNAHMWKGDFYFLLVKISSSDVSGYEGIIADIESKWQILNPQYPFDYKFLSQDFDAAFESQRRFGKVIDTFTVLAIIIAILGLIGLISFTTEQRTKEFGIRKVLGASIGNLMQLITVDFMKLLGIGFIMGTVISWYYGRQWLESFAYRTDISIMIYLLSGLILLTLILSITYFIIQKNALKNPAMTLRDE